MTASSRTAKKDSHTTENIAVGLLNTLYVFREIVINERVVLALQVAGASARGDGRTNRV